jgi:chromosome segregation ATPase
MRRMRDAMDRQHGYMPRVTAGGGADTEYYERELARLNAERMDREAALHAAEQRAMSAQETALSAQAELAQKEAEFDREFSDAEAIIENMRNANQHLQNVLANHIQTNHLNPAVEAAASAAAAAAAAADSQSMERRTSTALGSTGNMEKVRELEDQLSKLRAKLATATEHEDEAHQAAEVAAQRAQRAEQECAEARAAVLMAQADAAEANDGKRGLEATLKQKKEDLATMQAQIDTQMRELNVLKAEVRELKFVIEDQKSHAQDMRRDRHEVEVSFILFLDVCVLSFIYCLDFRPNLARPKSSRVL